MNKTKEEIIIETYAEQIYGLEGVDQELIEKYLADFANSIADEAKKETLKEVKELLKNKADMETKLKDIGESEKDEFFIAYHMGAVDTITELLDSDQLKSGGNK